MAATCSMSFNTHGLAMREETIYGVSAANPNMAGRYADNLIPVHFIREGSVIVLPSTTKRPLPR